MLSKVQGKINQRPKHTGYYTRVSDTLQKKTLPKIKKSEGDRQVQGSDDSGKQGNFRYVEKRANNGMSTSPKSVCERLVLVGKKDGGNHPLTNLKKFNKLITLQNGRFTLSKVHVATRGLHVQFRHEGFLLFGCLTQKLQEQSSFSMVREALRIPLSVFWLRTSPKNFYQNFKSANIPNKEIEYQNSNLSRQHVVAGKVNQGGSDSNRHCNFLIPTSRICNRPQKVHFNSPTKNIVFRSTI